MGRPGQGSGRSDRSECPAPRPRPHTPASACTPDPHAHGTPPVAVTLCHTRSPPLPPFPTACRTASSVVSKRGRTLRTTATVAGLVAGSSSTMVLRPMLPTSRRSSLPPAIARSRPSSSSSCLPSRMRVHSPGRLVMASVGAPPPPPPRADVRQRRGWARCREERCRPA